MSGENRTGRTVEPTLTRRSFLKTTGAVAGAAAIAGTATPGLQALAADEAREAGGTKVVHGRCFTAGCFSCEYNVMVRDGHVVKVFPDPDAPLGRRPCLRALCNIQRLYSKERIKYPMKRAGERGENKWERISWDEAISLIAEKWKGYIDEYDGRSIALYQGTGGSRQLCLVRNRLSFVLGMTAIDLSVDWGFGFGNIRVQGSFAPKNMTGPGNEPMEEDIFHAKKIFLWSCNHSESYQPRWRYVCDAQEKGAMLIAIDSNHVKATDRADRWFSPRPGSDTLLTLAMIQVILEEGIQDTEYLISDTVGPFLVREDTKKFLRMSDLGVAPTEGPVSATTGKPTIVDPPVVWNAEKNEAGSSAEVANPALEGSFEVNGIKTNTAYSLLVAHVQDYTPEIVAADVEMDPEDIRELARLAADGPCAHIAGMGSQSYLGGLAAGFSFGVLMAVTGSNGKPGAGRPDSNYPVPTPPTFVLPSGKLATSISVLDMPEVIRTGKYGGKDYPPIKSLFISSGGLVTGAVNRNSVLHDIIDKVEFVVTADIVFSDSARWSDLILPCAYQYEIEDICSVPYANEVQYNDRIVEPAFEAKTDSEMCTLIARAVGVGEWFEPQNDEEWLRMLLDVPALKEKGVTLEALREKHTIRIKDKGFIYGGDGTYPTSTGKVEFYCESPFARLEHGQERDDDKEHLPHFTPPYEFWPGTEAIKKYPLQLISLRSRYRFHSQGFDAPWINEIDPEPFVRVNPVDADARGIEDGEYVEVYNDRGHAVAKAYRCGGVRPGTMAYAKGWQSHQYKVGNFSELTHSVHEAYISNSSFYDCCVEIRKWNGGE